MLVKCQSGAKSREERKSHLLSVLSESSVHCALKMVFSIHIELVGSYSTGVSFSGKADILTLIKLYICIINKNVIDTVVRIYGVFPVS